MNWRVAPWIGVGALALLVAAGGAWILSLPPAPTIAAAPPIAEEEAEATLTALKPPKRRRPLIAIVGINDATEVTDYLMPYGVLRRSGVADVVLLATQPGPVSYTRRSRSSLKRRSRSSMRSIRTVPTMSSSRP